MRRRIWLFAAACAMAVAAVLVYVALTAPAAGVRTSSPQPSATARFISSVPDGPLILFRDVSSGPASGHLAVSTLPLTGAAPLIAPLSCERVHYAAGSGVCMVIDDAHLPSRYLAYVFDRSFQRRHTITLTGLPIRARVSPDGRRAAFTVFEKGHSYADDDFSTRTTVIEISTGRQIADLEDMTVSKDGRPFKAVDFNFWGLTFTADGNRFFATLKTHGEHYLVEGSIDARTMTVMRPGVECPSLSPDGTLIAFKKPLDGQIGWRLHVLDLRTGAEHALNQSGKSVDDQVDWFDATHVVYHDSSPQGMGIWALSVDGVTPARLLVSNAYSPAVQR